MKSAIAYVAYSLNTRCRLLTQNCSRKLSLTVPKFCSLVFKTKIVQQIGKLPLSPDTCARRCDDLSGDIFTQLMTKLRACPSFSLALDESTDKSDTAQLMVSVRYFNEGVS